MVKCVIKPDDFDQLLAKIKTSKDTLYDFSGTDFGKLSTTQFSALFIALGSLPHPFTLKLNYCSLNEKNLGAQSQLNELTLGLSVTKNMKRFEFVRSLSVDCKQEVLEKIAESLLRNHHLTSITLDGYRVTPPRICEVLKNHPTVKEIIVDGLPQAIRKKNSLFTNAANESISDVSGEVEKAYKINRK